MCSSKGFTYLESLVAMAIIGVCSLILSVSFHTRVIYKQKAEYQTKAVAALSSQTDLIRSGVASRIPGQHTFHESEKLLKGLPAGKAVYTVTTFPGVPGLLRVHLQVRWMDQTPQERALEIYVRQ